MKETKLSYYNHNCTWSKDMVVELYYFPLFSKSALHLYILIFTEVILHIFSYFPVIWNFKLECVLAVNHCSLPSRSGLLSVKMVIPRIVKILEQCF